jgi:hypothetical protein
MEIIHIRVMACRASLLATIHTIRMAKVLSPHADGAAHLGFDSYPTPLDCLANHAPQSGTALEQPALHCGSSATYLLAHGRPEKGPP